MANETGKQRSVLLDEYQTTFLMRDRESSLFLKGSIPQLDAAIDRIVTPMTSSPMFP